MMTITRRGFVVSFWFSICTLRGSEKRNVTFQRYVTLDVVVKRQQIYSVKVKIDLVREKYCPRTRLPVGDPVLQCPLESQMKSGYKHKICLGGKSCLIFQRRGALRSFLLRLFWERYVQGYTACMHSSLISVRATVNAKQILLQVTIERTQRLASG